ncbi:Integrase, catalytic core protein, partial [Phytophthora megakarya]
MASCARHQIEVFGSDQGRELVKKPFRAFIRSKGVELIWTNSYSPEENGLVEKMNGVVLSRLRSILTTVDLPDLLWGEVFACAVEVLNVSPSCALAGETPSTRRFRERPDVSELRTWGYLAFSFTQKVLRKSKLENPGKPGIFLGYEKNSISYRVMDLKSGKVQELRTVEFAEDWTVERSYVKILLLHRYAKALGGLDDEWASDSEDLCDDNTRSVIANGDPMENISRSVGAEEGEMENSLGASVRRSTRVRRPNDRLRDYEVEIAANLVVQAVNELLEPTSVTETLSAPDAKKWIAALETEYKERMRNHVWELVERPPGVKVLKNKWVFVRKRNAQGEVCRYRTRITIKRCQQQYGVNFWEIYEPVAKAESVRFVLLLALSLGLLCRQVDFVTAFLNGPLDEADIYMEQPDYFDDGTGCVFKLLQSLYGLRQAPRIWYKMLD